MIVRSPAIWTIAAKRFFKGFVKNRKIINDESRPNTAWAPRILPNARISLANTPKIYKDLRTLTDTSEYLTRITVPATIEKWSTSLLDLEDETSEFILSGKRTGNTFQFEISIFKKPLRKQLRMVLK